MLTFLAGMGLIAAPAAQAGHNEPGVYVAETKNAEGAFTIDTYWQLDEHQVTNGVLVVEINDAVVTYPFPVGSDLWIETGDPCTDTVVTYRVFGGGERSYDLPLWDGYGEPGFVDTINGYGAANGWDWTTSGTDNTAPFVNWLETTVSAHPFTDCTEPEPTGPPHDGGESVAEQAKTGAPIAHANGKGKRFQVEE